MIKLEQDIAAVEAALTWWRRSRRTKIWYREHLPAARGERMLCGLYREGGCAGCPVREHSGRPNCEGTPAHGHQYWGLESDEQLYAPAFLNRWWRVLAAEMVSFLNEIRTKLVRGRQYAKRINQA